MKQLLFFILGFILCVAIHDILFYDRAIEIYGCNELYYVYPMKNEIHLESRVEIYKFRSYQEMKTWIADMSADGKL